LEKKEENIEILDVWESDVGLYVRVRFPDGSTTQVNFNKTVSDDEVKRTLKSIWETRKQARAMARTLKKGDKIKV